MLDVVPEDVLADPAAFLFARDFARARGYRLVLHGVTTALLSVLPVKRLGLDLVHLRWSDDLVGADLAALQVEPQHILLGQTDHDAALDWGLYHGIGLFAGTMVNDALRGRGGIAVKP
jgi:hypothetical protein